MIQCPKTPQSGVNTSDSYFVTSTDDDRHRTPQQPQQPPVAMPLIHSATAFFHTSKNTSVTAIALPHTPVLHPQNQDFYNAIQTRFSDPFVASDNSSNISSSSRPLSSLAIRCSRIRSHYRSEPIPARLSPAIARRLRPYSPETVHNLNSHTLLLIDIRSFVHYANIHIQCAINVSIPNTILKRPTFTLDKVAEAIAEDSHRTRWRQWPSFDHIVMYDQRSDTEPDAHSAITFLAIKFHLANYHGSLGYLKGGLGAYAQRYSDQCIVSAQPAAAAPPPITQPAGAPAPFFSNIRQNMELSHESIKDRFLVRLPPDTHLDDTSFPLWLKTVLLGPSGPTRLAEKYEVIERAEQKRLQTMMSHHAKHYTNTTDHPLSIVAGLEMGALNRYTNIWPFEYTRVNIRENGCYINASYIEYSDTPPAFISSKPDDVPDLKPLCEYQPPVSTEPPNSIAYRRYIATQGPLPSTFNDFWTMVWEQNTRVIIMLTREEEMSRIKCHRYWPSQPNTPMGYGSIQVTLLHETTICSNSSSSIINDVENDKDDRLIVRHLQLEKDNGKIHTVQHIQYLGWMDYGVPDNPRGTLACVKLADEFQKASPHGPMIVHCSAGCGRTGAFCTIDTVLHRLQRLKEEAGGGINATIDDMIYQTVSKFREQRVSMVQTLRQYVFCYETILWWILGNG